MYEITRKTQCISSCHWHTAVPGYGRAGKINWLSKERGFRIFFCSQQFSERQHSACSAVFEVLGYLELEILNTSISVGEADWYFSGSVKAQGKNKATLSTKSSAGPDVSL